VAPSISFEKVDLEASEAGQRRVTRSNGATAGKAG